MGTWEYSFAKRKTQFTRMPEFDEPGIDYYIKVEIREPEILCMDDEDKDKNNENNTPERHTRKSEYS